MTHHQRDLHQGRFLTFRQREGWEYIARRHPVAVIIAWTPADELLLVEQHRIPVDGRTLELPAGLVGDTAGQETESLLDAAARELEEETGWRPGRMKVIMRCPTSPGMSDELATFIAAGDLVRAGPGGGDATESIRVHRVPRGEIAAWLAERAGEGLLIDPKIHAALYWSGLVRPPSSSEWPDSAP